MGPRTKTQTFLLIFGSIIRCVDSVFLHVVAIAGGVVDLPEVEDKLKNSWGIDISRVGIVGVLFWCFILLLIGFCFFIPKKVSPQVRHIDRLTKRLDYILKLKRKNKIDAKLAMDLLQKLVRVESRTMIRVVFGKAEHSRFIECVQDGFESDDKLGAIMAGREFLLSLKTKKEEKQN